jgi:F-type H+-transporting ATPase subunit epsilon
MILEIVSPEAKLFSGEISSISVPGVDGRFQMLNNHAPIVSLLQKGTINITTAGNFD